MPIKKSFKKLIRAIAIQAATLLDKIWTPLAISGFESSAKNAREIKNPVILHAVIEFSKSAETFIYDLLTGLENDGQYKNIVLTYNRTLLNERPFPDVVTIKRFAPRHWQQPAIHQVISRLEPALIHGHFAPTIRLVDNMRRLWGINIPAIISTHGYDVMTLAVYDEELQRLVRWAAKESNILFTVPSEFLRPTLESLGVDRRQIMIHSNTFNTAFSNQRKIEYYNSGTRTLKLICNGRLVPFKGHCYVLRAIAIVANEIPGITLTLLSDGPERDNLTRLAGELGILDRIIFKGRVPHTSIPSILQQHDLFIHPSIKDPETGQEETFGVAILEAIASGLPVIASSSGGIPEVIGDGSPNHRLVSPEDADAIAAAILSMQREKCLSGIDESYRTERLSTFSQTSNIRRMTKAYQKCRALH